MEPVDAPLLWLVLLVCVFGVVMSFPFKFIHIGMGKCASTYLQSVLFHDSAYNLIDLSDLAETALECADKGLSEPMIPNLNFDEPGCWDAPLVASSESFVYGFIDDGGSYKLETLYRVSAKIIGGSRLTGKVLLVVRNPIDWLRSAHGQFIRQGGCVSYKSYYKGMRNSLMMSLNIKKILNEFSSNMEVIVLSLDELKNSPIEFWDKFSENLGVNVPSDETLSKVDANKATANSALSGKRLIKLARLNEFSLSQNRLLSEMQEYKTYFPSEADILLTCTNNQKWINRRFCEYLSDEKLDSLVSMIRSDSEDGEVSDFSTVYIDNLMKKNIMDNFIQPLLALDTIPKSLVDGYIDSINNALVE